MSVEETEEILIESEEEEMEEEIEEITEEESEEEEMDEEIEKEEEAIFKVTEKLAVDMEVEDFLREAR